VIRKVRDTNYFPDAFSYKFRIPGKPPDVFEISVQGSMSDSSCTQQLGRSGSPVNSLKHYFRYAGLSGLIDFLDALRGDELSENPVFRQLPEPLVRDADFSSTCTHIFRRPDPSIPTSPWLLCRRDGTVSAKV
jgi:hypothetical protein